MIKLYLYILLNGICFAHTEGSISIQVPTAGNCEEDTVLTCQVSGGIGVTRWNAFDRNIMSNGNAIRPDELNKYTEQNRTSSFTLTIHNTSLTDDGNYRCSNNFDDSSTASLNIECKASSVKHKVTSGKKIQFIVDKLFPDSSTLFLTFERQNSAITVSGSEICSSSLQYSGYFRCVWTSNNSLDDGLYNYSAVVKTITQASPLTGSFKIVSPGSPLINNSVFMTNTLQLNASREVLYGNLGQPLSIQCASKGGYPAPTVTWYKNSLSNSNQLNSTSSETLQGDGTYTVKSKHTFTPSVTDDKIYLICRSYYPEASSGQVGSISKRVLFYLKVKPNQPSIAQPAVVSGGDEVTVNCKTTGCRPAASIAWFYQGVTYNGSTTSTFDTTTDTFTVISTYTNKVTAQDNEQTIKCIVTHPELVSPSELTESLNLTVHYPPSVSVIATNTTVKASNVNLTCIAKGFPDGNYTYGKWIQRWPGYNVPVSEKPGDVTLELAALTYEHSGCYTCTASNGIKIDGTHRDFVEGTATYLLVKSFPIILSLDDKIATKLDRNLTFSLDFFSNVPESVVKLYKNEKGEMIPTDIHSVTKIPVGVELPVFANLITSNGTRASLTIPIRSMKDYGNYIVIVSNEIGSGNKTFEVVMTEPPSAPSAFTTDYVQYNKARLSWNRGYNGGLDQTFAIQIGTDENVWSNLEIPDEINQGGNRISTTLTNLTDSTTYYVRMFAYNEDGNSKLSDTLNFTTSPILVSVETNYTPVYLVSMVLGLFNVVLMVYAICVTILLKKKKKRRGVSKHRSCQTYTVNTDDSFTTTIEDAQMRTGGRCGIAIENHYTGLDQDLRESEVAYCSVTSI